MFLFLSKALPPLVYPLGLSCLLVLMAIFLWKRPKLQRAVLLTIFILLWLGSSTWGTAVLRRGLEWQYLPGGELPKADVIVVLGGGTLSASYPRPTVEVSGEGDRVLYAAYLYHQGKAPHLLLSGGRIDWMENSATDASDMAALLEQMDIPAEALWLESRSTNTYENGLYSRRILEEKGIHRVLLVTSALHMPRAVGVFRRQGLEVIPAPTDFGLTVQRWNALLSSSPLTQLFNILPSADNLAGTTKALKEYLGLLVYRVRGWL